MAASVISAERLSPKPERRSKLSSLKIIGLADEKARCQPVFIVQLMVKAEIDAAGLVFWRERLEKLAFGQVTRRLTNMGNRVIIPSRIGQTSCSLGDKV